MKVIVRLGFWLVFSCSVTFLSACGGGGNNSVQPAISSSGVVSSSLQSSSVQSSSMQSSLAQSTSSTFSSAAQSISSAQSSSSVQSGVDALGYSKKAIFDDWFYDVTGYPNGFNFFLYVPISYRQKPDSYYPVVIVLHGDNGYRETRPALTTYPLPTGVFNNFLSDSGELTPTGRDKLNPHLKDAFVLHPEIPHIDRQVFQGEKLGWWNPEALNDMVEYIAKTYRIDESRIYVVGASMGGAGAFYYAATNPQKIAAIAPVCNGLYDYRNTAGALRDMPVWLFQNYDDDTVQFVPHVLPTVNQLVGQDVWALYPSTKPPTNDYTIGYTPSTGVSPWVLGSNSTHGVFNFTLYATGGHNAWSKTFAKDALWDWLFSQSKK